MKPAAETAAANAMPGRSPMISATSLWYGSTAHRVTGDAYGRTRATTSDERAVRLAQPARRQRECGPENMHRRLRVPVGYSGGHGIKKNP